MPISSRGGRARPSADSPAGRSSEPVQFARGDGGGFAFCPSTEVAAFGAGSGGGGGRRLWLPVISRARIW